MAALTAEHQVAGQLWAPGKMKIGGRCKTFLPGTASLPGVSGFNRYNQMTLAVRIIRVINTSVDSENNTNLTSILFHNVCCRV